MQVYTENECEFFYDRYQKLWVLYPINEMGERIEWDKNDDPIEAQYFNNKTELNNWLKLKKHASKI